MQKLQQDYFNNQVGAITGNVLALELLPIAPVCQLGVFLHISVLCVILSAADTAVVWVS